nr:hypothetical protein CFP56_74900 [Quercus suber]
MTTWFNMGELAEVQEKKAKTSPKGGLLTRKHQRHIRLTKDDPMVTSPVTTSVPHFPTLPTSSLELITPSNESSKANGRDKVPVGSFWEDAGAAILKAHKAIFVDNLQPLGVNSSHELMSSHVHKVMQVLGKSLYISGKYLDFEKKFVMAQSKVEALSSGNESLKKQIFALLEEVVEKEILEDHQTAEGIGKGGKVASVDRATVDPSSSNAV